MNLLSDQQGGSAGRLGQGLPPGRHVHEVVVDALLAVQDLLRAGLALDDPVGEPEVPAAGRRGGGERVRCGGAGHASVSSPATARKSPSARASTWPPARASSAPARTKKISAESRW